MPKSSSKSLKPSTRKKRRKVLQKTQTKQRKANCVFQFVSRVISSLVFWLLAFITVVSFLFLIYPRISIEPGESLDPYKPFETPFVIKNDGYWSLVNIDYDLNIDKMEDHNHNRFSNVTISGISDKIAKLRANESSTIFIRRAVSAPPGFIKYAELYIKTTYSPFLVPITFTENRRFKTDRKTDGQYVWFKYVSEKQ